MHLASPFLKSTFIEVLEKEYQALDEACIINFGILEGATKI